MPTFSRIPAAGALAYSDLLGFDPALESAVMWTHLHYAQTLTGFALALILLGLIGATDLMPLTDAVNAVAVIVLTAALTFLYRRWLLQLERSLWPAAASSVVGTVAGVIVLTWLAGAAYEVLRLLLGLSIVFYALLLWRAARPRKALSSRGAFVLAGGFSGLLGGMFSAPGPPLVYRQPLAHAHVQESLILFFGIGALLRLAIMVPAGRFSIYAVQLAVEAVPVVFFVTSLAAARPTPLPPKLLKAIVCLLLIATGAGMISVALSAISPGLC